MPSVSSYRILNFEKFKKLSNFEKNYCHFLLFFLAYFLSVKNPIFNKKKNYDEPFI